MKQTSLGPSYGGRPPKSTKKEPREAKRQRLQAELRQAGMTWFGFRKFTTHHLMLFVHDYEHIRAVIYGRYSEAPGLLNWVDRMVIATDRRLVSINHKPGYTDIDEFTYDMIGGVAMTMAGPFTGVTINTRIKSINVRFVNNNCAQKFVHYLEKRQLEYAE